jgi:hypothetical protein
METQTGIHYGYRNWKVENDRKRIGTGRGIYAGNGQDKDRKQTVIQKWQELKEEMNGTRKKRIM